MDRRSFLGLLGGSALALAGCENVQTRRVEVDVGDRRSRVHIVFSDRDRILIRDYYTRKRKHLPPGLAKKGKVPPGHARQMERWGQLPPGVRYRYLPADLERQLSRLPDGYVRIIVGADIGILDTRGRVVLDVIQDIADDDDDD